MSRIKDLMERAGLTQAELADRVQMSRQAVNKWCTKDVMPTDKDTLRRLADALGVDPSYLVFGEASAPMSSRGDDGTILIPCLDIKASCGFGDSTCDYPQILRAIQVEDEWLRVHAPFANKDTLNIITADGNSMAPTIKEGDMVLLDLSQNRIRSDAIYAFVLGEDLYIKRIQRIGNGYRIISDNDEQYKSFELIGEQADNIKVIGRVCSVGRFGCPS